MRVQELLREVRDTATWAYRSRTLPEPVERELAGLHLLEKLGKFATPRYVLPEAAKAWYRDEEFMRAYRRVLSDNDRSAERKYAVRTLAASVRDLPGDSVEAGVFSGATSWFICDALAGTDKRHHAFDSFEGLSDPTDADGDFWATGQLRAAEESVRQLLSPFSAEVHRGWIPAVFDTAELGPLCFAHIDVDLYEPTAASLERFYPLLVAGGILVCDDYGFTTCPGARRAVDEFMADRPEPIIDLPTAQSVIIKR